MGLRYYNSFRNNILKSGVTAGIDFSDAGTAIKVALIDETAYTFSAAHDFFDDISAGIVGTPVAITTKTVGSLGAGIFDGDDVTFPLVTAGSTVKSLLLYKDTGTPSTSPLICLTDEVSSGLPLLTSGTDVNIIWDAINGILKDGR